MSTAFSALSDVLNCMVAAVFGHGLFIRVVRGTFCCLPTLHVRFLLGVPCLLPTIFDPSFISLLTSLWVSLYN